MVTSSGGYFFHSDIGGIPVVEFSDNTNRKSSIGIAPATLRQRGDGQQGEEQDHRKDGAQKP